jgi:hypothetical protein
MIRWLTVLLQLAVAGLKSRRNSLLENLWVEKTASVQETVNLKRLMAELSRLIYRPVALSSFAQVTIHQAQPQGCLNCQETQPWGIES